MYTERGRSSWVEHNLAKVRVEGSNPFARSNKKGGLVPPFLLERTEDDPSPRFCVERRRKTLFGQLLCQIDK